jgi:RNA polymerase sporulation-specific sigma factor
MERSDDALVSKAQEGDTQALDRILRRYMPLVKAKANRPAAPGLERDDFLQEGMIGLFKAVRDFRVEIGAPFGAFAAMCVDRQIATAARAANRNKHVPLNQSVPLVFGDGAEEHPALKDSGALNPLTALISAESMQQAGKELTALESQVLGLRLNGRSYRDIAASTGLSEKSIDNALQRAKHKIDQ